MIALCFTSKPPLPSPGFNQQKEVDFKQPSSTEIPTISGSKTNPVFLSTKSQSPDSSLLSPVARLKSKTTFDFLQPTEPQLMVIPIGHSLACHDKPFGTSSILILTEF